MSDPTLKAKRVRFLLLASAGVVIGMVGGALILGGVDLKGLANQGFELLRSAGPFWFFVAMALLPAFAFPMLAFALSAGPAFSASLGLPLVLVLSLCSLTLNLVLSYWLARRWLRPLLTALLERLGYRLPEVDNADATDLLIILRVTPGVPFFAQNYLSGLARVPFPRYLLISCIITWAFNAAFVCFGDALLHGSGRLALLAIGVLAALTAGTHLLRRHYAARRRAS